MGIGLKDAVKLLGISIIACCAVFVCTLFLNYNIDLVTIENGITTEAGVAMYNAQVSMGKVVAVVTGGCLVATSIVMLLFYIKNFIDVHGKELGILKAIGYSNIKIAKRFWRFGFSVLVGCVAGFVIAFLYLPTFYEVQNAEGLFPDLNVRFHPTLAFLLIGAPTIVFTAVSVSFAYFKLKAPVLHLLREKRGYKAKIGKTDKKDLPFLKGLSSTTLKSKKNARFLRRFFSVLLFGYGTNVLVYACACKQNVCVDDFADRIDTCLYDFISVPYKRGKREYKNDCYDESVRI